MRLVVAVRALIVVGVVGFGVTARAEEGYGGVLKAALRQAKLTKASQTLLAAAREFDRNPSESSLKAFEARMVKLQKSLDKTRNSVSEVQRSLGGENAESSEGQVSAQGYMAPSSGFNYSGTTSRIATPSPTPQVAATATPGTPMLGAGDTFF
jgi:hypothetical protein